MNYCEKLPRKVKGKRCCALTEDGAACRKKAVAEVYYHGASHEVPSEEITSGWVRAYMCTDHIPNIDRIELGL
jgi:hypothetical protein